jgi:hypothetical protein
MSALDMSALPPHFAQQDQLKIEQLRVKMRDLSEHNMAIDKHINDLELDLKHPQNKRVVGVIEKHINDLYWLRENNYNRFKQIRDQIHQLENPRAAAWHDTFFSNLFTHKKIPEPDKRFYPGSVYAMGRPGLPFI